MQNPSTELDNKTALLANSVHEIRTPVQTIISTLELLSETKLNDEQAEYVNHIGFSSNVLLSLINNILDFSKIQSNQFKLESITFDIINLTEQSADFVTIEGFGKKLEIVTDIDYTLPRYFVGDPTRLQEVLINLMKNAVKFTAKGYVHLNLKKNTGTDGKNETLLFEISDTGIGIPEDKTEKIFTDFYQADTSISREYGGTGLGLAICKNLVTAMQGEIGVRKNAGGGAVFWFTLPFTVADTQQTADNPQCLNTSAHDEFSMPADVKILIVDDSVLALESMKHKLESLGLANIEMAQNAKQALQMLLDSADAGKPFNIAFIDMIMPRVDGWHLAAYINEHESLKDLKRYLIVPEGQMGGEAKMKLMKWFTGYLYKPIKREKLRTVLRETYDAPTDVEPLDLPAKKIDAEFDINIAKGLHILVVEDYSVNKKLLAQFLEKFGATVHTASNGNEAIEQVKKYPNISVIFMDIQMPVLDGIAATEKLRAQRYNGIIIACTAENGNGDFAKYAAAGLNDLLIKPFKRSDIKSILEKWKIAVSAISADALCANAPDDDIAPDEKLDAKKISDAQEIVFWSEKEFDDTISNNKIFGINILKDYCTQTRKLLNSAFDAIATEDFEELRRIGHTISGSSGAISAYVLCENGKKLNEMAKLKDKDNSKTAYTLTRKNFLKFEQMVRKWEKRNE